MASLKFCPQSLVEIAFVIAVFVQSLAINIKKFTKRKKRQKKPRGWLITYIILSSMAFFYSKRLITAT